MLRRDQLMASSSLSYCRGVSGELQNIIVPQAPCCASLHAPSLHTSHSSSCRTAQPRKAPVEEKSMRVSGDYNTEATLNLNEDPEGEGGGRCAASPIDSGRASDDEPLTSSLDSDGARPRPYSKMKTRWGKRPNNEIFK
ncbi:hypothetical protein PHYPSEUDO_003463 [Phytophthora pseudosyringae]|uniref:Uncharacterized protein n=1 Tax=Phytophthora pseudosyringae TaxID=221518 RepID=A0A8T1VUF6_9STRA|nr:hypothetical protein PHYPSEUDO_003463 [Phytophthora pseudosyringae]